MDLIETTRFRCNGISIYRDVLEDSCISELLAVLGDRDATADETAQRYGRFFARLCESPYGANLCDYLFARVLYADNQFSRSCARGEYLSLPIQVKDAVERDLNALSALCALTCSQLKAHMATRFPEYDGLIGELPTYKHKSGKFSMSANWGEDMIKLAEHYKKSGFGQFVTCRAFTVETDGGLKLVPISHPDDIQLADLKDYERERGFVVDNTISLLEGRPANNILLYGDRGTGKSSTVKAVLNEYVSRGLRLIEIPKRHLPALGRIIDMLADSPLKFIIFADDLSFSDHDDSYTALKAVLEGSVSKLPPNMVIYATSNRRHLLRETFQGREGDEVHLADTRDEEASLSDRFGITVTFLAPDKLRFLEIVAAIAADRKLAVEPDALSASANRWAAHRGSFSPRTASQFVDWAGSRLDRGLDI